MQWTIAAQRKRPSHMTWSFGAVRAVQTGTYSASAAQNRLPKILRTAFIRITACKKSRASSPSPPPRLSSFLPRWHTGSFSCDNDCPFWSRKRSPANATTQLLSFPLSIWLSSPALPSCPFLPSFSLLSYSLLSLRFLFGSSPQSFHSSPQTSPRSLFPLSFPPPGSSPS